MTAIRLTDNLQNSLFTWIDDAQKLVNLLDEQSGALIERDVEQIETLRFALEKQFERLSELDRQRDETICALANAYKAQPTLKSISPYLDAKTRKVLMTASAQATRLAEAIRLSMLRNRTLIENELVYVEGTLSLIAKAAKETTPYGGASAAPLWVNKVA